MSPEQPPANPQAFGADVLPPPEIAAKAVRLGVAKASLGLLDTLALGMLAGAFIGLGAMVSTVATAGGGLPYGIERVVGGVTFSLGLVLVVLAGAELFTGNNLVTMAWASRSVSAARVLRHWAIVYVGNFAGALATAGLVFASQAWQYGGGAVGEKALAIAQAKVGLDFGRAIALGVLCNGLVCLAVWLSYGARSTTDKVLAVVPPIAAFVAAGFEHSIANMYFVPLGIFLRDEPGLDAATGAVEPTWSGFLLDNLLPVTIGNVLGGTVLVAAVYWFVYLRPRSSRE